MTNWPDASAVASATVLLAVAQLDLRVRRRATGDDRFARRLDRHDVEGRLDGGRRGVRRRGLSAWGADAARGGLTAADGAALWPAELAAGTVGAVGSGARASIGVEPGPGHRKSG